MPLAQPSKAPDLQGLGRHLPGFLQETAAQDPALGRGERPSKLRPYSAWVSGPSCSSLGERRCHVPAGLLELGRWLHGRQRPGILGKGSEEGQARASGAVLDTSMCKVQAAGAAGEHSLGEGISIWSVGGV